MAESAAPLEGARPARGASIAAREAELAVKNLVVSDKERELLQRRGWRWWLKLPLIRLGLLK